MTMFLRFLLDCTRSMKGVLFLVRSITVNLQSACSCSVDGRGSCSAMVPRPIVAGTAISGPHTLKISERFDPRLSTVVILSVFPRVPADVLMGETLKTLSDFQSIILYDGGGVWR